MRGVLVAQLSLACGVALAGTLTGTVELQRQPLANTAAPASQGLTVARVSE